ncbi:MAG: amino acid ABC transporter permease [Actinobacteria bacterium]|nr:amino acid ABC transporter permease [Actinomycetota bacterium]
MPLAYELPEWVRPVAVYMLREGLPETLKLAAVAVTVSALIGILLGTFLTIHFRPLQALLRFYIEVWRGLPIIVTILFIYWLPALHVLGQTIQLDAYTAAAVGLSLWGSAQVAEATRGAVQSIPKEQHEAAAALGFGWLGRHAFVIVPQALRRLLPPFVGLLVNIIQNTTIAFVIGVNEFLQAGQRQVENLTTQTGNPHAFEIFAGVLVVFFIISFPLTMLARYLERRLV